MKIIIFLSLIFPFLVLSKKYIGIELSKLKNGEIGCYIYLAVFDEESNK